jgi:predicted 3-demethylubiquinone-9 3-methyltransferase (glyoxalase superfamily)
LIKLTLVKLNPKKGAVLMQKISPFLWFDDNAVEATNFYVSVFPNSKILSINGYERDTPPSPNVPGSVRYTTFELYGQVFNALNGGPYFKITPAISFFVNCETHEEIDTLWQKLTDGGMALMGLDQYPFSEKFGWVQDKFGVSWQLNLAKRTQKITPFLMFFGDQYAKAEEAMNLYASLFTDSHIGEIERFGPGEMGVEGTIKLGSFYLAGQEFMVSDSNFPHKFTFTEGLSFFVNCETQQEVDFLWEKLSAGGTIQQCGWLKDPFGVSWQIIPTILSKLLNDPDPVKSKRVMDAMLQMKKIDSDMLIKAYEGEV